MSNEKASAGKGNQGTAENLGKHYVCIGGCGMVADQRLKCNRPGCPRNRNPLTECHCSDGKHDEVLGFLRESEDGIAEENSNLSEAKSSES